MSGASLESEAWKRVLWILGHLNPEQRALELTKGYIVVPSMQLRPVACLLASALCIPSLCYRESQRKGFKYDALKNYEPLKVFIWVYLNWGSWIVPMAGG